MGNRITLNKFRMFSAIIFSASMMPLIPSVKAQDKSTSSAPANQKFQDSASAVSPTDFKNFIEVLARSGEDGRISENLSPLIGLSGSLPVRGSDFTTPRPDGKIYKECSIVYAADSTSTAKHPICVYLNKKIVKGTQSESYWYRLNLQGTLEKVSILQGKYDVNGKAIPGSGVTVEKDITSPEVLKAFKIEFAYWTKDWLKQQKKSAAAAEKR